ncbi:MAG: nucleoside triphosphate pyrophosphatase [Thermostichales cyanobacterium SZTDM-1c_bins_54]
MPLPPLILASQSPARRQLLSQAGIPHTAEPSYFDEDSIQDPNPRSLVQTLALKKAEIIAARHPEPAIIVGADSVLWLQGEILGKPETPAIALARLKQMRGQVGELYTGMALIQTVPRRQLVHYAMTRVFFARPSEAELQAYVATREPLQCAGCFALDGLGSFFVEGIDGCHSNVIGLSLPLLRRMFLEWGYDITEYWG